MLRLLLLLALLLVQGCSWMPWSGQEDTQESRPARPGAVDLDDAAAVRSALFEQFYEWRGVPWRMGGQDRRGLDCSAFAQITFRSRFGIDLPRESSSQRETGREVPLARVRPGDLLFFDTGMRTSHVGIYAGERQFLHVSTHAGVMFSSLEDAYWRPRLDAVVRPR